LLCSVAKTDIRRALRLERSADERDGGTQIAKHRLGVHADDAEAEAR
jgi:hypothetical protein